VNQPKAPRFTVYHIESTMEEKSFYREFDAKKLLANLNAKRPGKYAYTTVENYRDNVVHLVTRINLMSKKEYQEPSNTPGYMSPASEAYWSM
jgi:hypothetical protein